jgi:hypothetical protein
VKGTRLALAKLPTIRAKPFAITCSAHCWGKVLSFSLSVFLYDYSHHSIYLSLTLSYLLLDRHRHTQMHSAREGMSQTHSSQDAWTTAFAFSRNFSFLFLCSFTNLNTQSMTCSLCSPHKSLPVLHASYVFLIASSSSTK